MSAVLFKIPLVQWVRQTIEAMNAAESDDRQSWSRFWLQTYLNLNGSSESSGSKGCPRAAAYGLWQLGRIVDSGKPFQTSTVKRVASELGKNAAYAFLALNLFESGWDPADTEGLWAEIQMLYRQELAEEPANSEQGEVKVASVLFAESQIIIG